MLSIKQACDRYNLSSTKSLYTRLNGLKVKGIDTELVVQGKTKKSFITEELLRHLDDLHLHLSQRGTIANYQPITDVETIQNRDDTALHDGKELANAPRSLEVAIDRASIQEIAIAVAGILQPLMPPADGSWKLQELRLAARFGYQLTTSQVRSLIGIKPVTPKGKTSFVRGSFEFCKVGKIGKQNAWVVESRK